MTEQDSTPDRKKREPTHTIVTTAATVIVATETGTTIYHPDGTSEAYPTQPAMDEPRDS